MKPSMSLSKENTSYYSLYIPGYVTDGRRSKKVAYEKINNSNNWSQALLVSGVQSCQ